MKSMLVAPLAIAACIVAGGAAVRAESIRACHGYSCHFSTPVSLGPAQVRRFSGIMRAGAASPAAERKAISRAVQHFERLSTVAIGIRDRAKSDFGAGRERGQMDCIDESRNTRAFLTYLAGQGLLKHHRVRRNASRGFFADGRYPHATAVIEDAGGMRWTVDSWFEPAGGAPDIMPLERWRRRGVMGER